MKSAKQNFYYFRSAFLRTAKEQRAYIPADKERHVLNALAGMRRYWRNTNRFHQIRYGEMLASRLAEVQRES